MECRSWKWNNFFLDTGPHIFHTDNLNFGNFGKIIWKNLIPGTYRAKNVIESLLKLSRLSVIDRALINYNKKRKQIKKELKNLNVDKKKAQHLNRM